MKKYIQEFMRRGLAACGFGPMILAALYLVLHWQGIIQVLTVKEVCLGIFTLSALAFVAGGMNMIYGIERLPLMPAILIHGSVLYSGYLLTYLINGWLDRGAVPILVFSGIFVVGYLGSWAIIYFITRKNTTKLNEKLQQKQQQEM